MTSIDGSRRTLFAYWITLALVAAALGALLALLPAAGSATGRTPRRRLAPQIIDLLYDLRAGAIV